MNALIVNYQRFASSGWVGVDDAKRGGFLLEFVKHTYDMSSNIYQLFVMNSFNESWQENRNGF